MATGIDSTTSLIAPDIAAQQVMLGRRQQMADLLRQQSLTPDQGQMIGAQYIAPSWTQGLAKMAQALMASKSQDDIDAQNLDLAKSYGDRIGAMFGQGAPDSSTAAPAALAQGALQDDVGPTISNAARMGTILAQGGGTAPQGGGLTINGMSPSQAKMAFMLDKGAYMGGYMKQFDPTEFQKDLRLLPQGQQSAAVNQKFFPPIVARENAPIFTRDASGKIVIEPASIEGIRQVYDAKAPSMPMRELPIDDGQGGYTAKLTEPEYQTYIKTGGLPDRYGGKATAPVPATAPNGALTSGPFQGKASDIVDQITALPEPDRSSAMSQYIRQLGLGESAGSQANPSGTTPQSTPSAATVIGKTANAFSTEFTKEQAKSADATEQKIYSDAAAAQEKLAASQKMLSLLPQITTGPAAGRITTVKNLASSFGINLGDPAPNQEFGKYAFGAAMQAAKQVYGNRITNSDMEAMINNSPGATMDEKAIYSLIKFDNEKQLRFLNQASAYDQYKASGKPLNRFPIWFSQNYPLQGISAPQAGQTATLPEPSQPSGSPTVDYVNKYGIKAKK